ncbi:MAG: hypothetical protein OES09_15290 [Gammaproteobacteria bacterium]|nr:hypothetical protein [Gammaproteobacteria bacterium]
MCWLLVCGLLVASCTTAITVPDTVFPTPLIDPIPAKVALVYGEEFRNYEKLGPILRDSAGRDISQGMKIRHELGNNNVSLFNQLSATVFERSQSFSSWDALENAGEEFDAILEPTVDRFESWRGDDGSFRSPGAFLHLTYRVRMYRHQRNEIMDWPLATHQVFCKDVTFCGMSNLGDMVEAGLRDIAAQFYAKFPELPEVVAWMETLKADR